MKTLEIRQKQLLPLQALPICGLSNVYEAMMRMMKYSTSLARVMTEYKVETNPWYTEAIPLKGELQKAQKLLMVLDSNLHRENVFKEVDTN